MRISLAFLTLSLCVAGMSPAFAETFVQYQCEDGAQVSAMFPEGQRRAFLQLDGHAITLPQRLSADGARYAKGGITFWIKGKAAQLKRPKTKWTQCQAS
jgi:membrane-bound inhibitor of C-type lysozyme